MIPVLFYPAFSTIQFCSVFFCMCLSDQVIPLNLVTNSLLLYKSGHVISVFMTSSFYWLLFLLSVNFLVLSCVY